MPTSHELFQQLVPRLKDDQLFWFVAVTIKTMMADETLGDSEMTLLRDVYQLIDDNPTLLGQVRKQARSLSLNDLPEVRLPPETAETLVQYLISIAVSDQDFDDGEESVIRAVANKLAVHSDRVDKMLETADEFRF